MLLHKFALAGVLSGLLVLVGTSEAARAEVSAVAVGVSRAVPLTKASQTLDIKTGVQADLIYKHENLPEPLAFHVTGTYSQFPVLGWSDTKLNYFGFYLGVIAQPQTTSFISPFVSLQVGTGYKSLSYTAADPVQNSSTSLAVNLMPGFDVHVAGPVSATMQLPWTTVFTTEKLQLWSGVLSAKVKL